ncbi:MAG TPA: SRPBCC domain-containing protein [Candidatus Binataceae bacterium]
MDARNNAAVESSDLELVIERVFDAPRELVFKAWSAPAHLAHWWGPNGFTLPVCEMDFRSGGAYRFCMRGSEGDDHWVAGVFREVVEPSRIVMSGAWVDADGKPTRPATVTTVTFAEHNGKTKLTLHNGIFESVSARDAHRSGWSASIERLAEYLAAA